MAELFKDQIFPCVQCGFCCTEGRLCGYGEHDREKNQCEFLTAESKCSKHDEIVALESNSDYPTFGWGCSSPMFNERRDAMILSDIEALHLGEILQEIFRGFIEDELSQVPPGQNDGQAGNEIEIVIPWGQE